MPNTVLLLSPVTMSTSSIPQDVYEKLLTNPLAQIETLYTSYHGIVIARTTGMVSAISSAIIIYIVLRSKTRLSSAYHRIMFGMSIADTCGSLAIFTSTWMMPKDMIYRQFQGAVLGNWITCNIQGTFFFIGSSIAFSFNTVLCLYYFCVMSYGMSEERFRRRVEPILMFFAIVLPSILITMTVAQGLMAPTPLDLTCTGALYPYWCITGTDVEEENGKICLEVKLGGPSGDFIKWSYFLLYIVCSIIVFTSMFLVCRTVYVTSKSVDKFIRASRHRYRIDSEYVQSQWTQTKIIFKQAMGYLGAFFLCQLFPFASLLSREKNLGWQYFHVIFRPLQGLFNFVIFIAHKIHTRRRANIDLTRWQAFCEVMKSSGDDPTFYFDDLDRITLEAENNRESSVVEMPISLTQSRKRQMDEAIASSPALEMAFGVGTTNPNLAETASNVKIEQEIDDTNDSQGGKSIISSLFSMKSDSSITFDSKAISNGVSTLNN